jgi:hypothetical protein
LLLGLTSVVLAGCPGDLDPRLMGGGGGTGGSQICDAQPIMVAKCGQPGCHSESIPQAGLDLKSAGVAARLLAAPVAGANASCTDDLRTAYLTPNSNPATGFFFQKLTSAPPCGLKMPELGDLTANEMSCLQEWATAVTTGQISP